MQTEKIPPEKSRWSVAGSITLSGIALRLIILTLIDAFAIWFFIQLTSSDSSFLAWTVAALALFVNVVVLRQDAFPIRWMLLGLVLMLIFAVYPIVFTIVVSTTNYGFGNLLTKQQVIDRLEDPRTNGFFAEEGNYNSASGCNRKMRLESLRSPASRYSRPPQAQPASASWMRTGFRFQ